MGGIRPFDTLSEHFDTNEVTSASCFILGASLSPAKRTARGGYIVTSPALFARRSSVHSAR